MRTTPFLLALALLFPVMANGQATAGPEAGQKVAFLGDSITQFGFQKPAGYVNLVAKAMEISGKKIEVIPAGVSGNTSRDMLARIKGVLDKKPDWMTLSCGVNDVWHGEKGCTLDEYKTNITAIVDQATTAGVKVVILTATLIQENPDNDLNKKAADYNAFLKSLAKERKLTLVDLNADEIAALAKMKVENSSVRGTHLTVDGVHMNGYGDQMMATGILKGFGLTDEQLATAKQTWDTMPGAFPVPNFGLSVQQYEKLQALAESQHKALADLVNDLVQKNIDTLADTPAATTTPPPASATAPTPSKP